MTKQVKRISALLSAFLLMQSFTSFSAPEDNFRYIDYPGMHSFEKRENGYIILMPDVNHIYLDKHGNETEDIVGVTDSHIIFYETEDVQNHVDLGLVDHGNGPVQTYSVETIHQLHLYDDNNNLFAVLPSDTYDVSEKYNILAVMNKTDNTLQFYSTADGSLLSSLSVLDYTICNSFASEPVPDLTYFEYTKDGVFPFTNAQGLSGICDIYGNIILEPQYTALRLCDPKKSYFTAKQDNKTMLIDKDGNILLNLDGINVMSPCYKDENSKLYYEATTPDGIRTFFDKNLNKIEIPVPDGHTLVNPLTDDLYIIRRTEDTDRYEAKCGIINSEGEIILPLEYYSFIELVSDNLFTARHTNYENGNGEILADLNGNIIAKNLYNVTETGENGWIGIESEDFSGYINEKGEVMLTLPHPYRPATSFQEGKASIKDDGMMGDGWGSLSGNHHYIDEDGNKIITGDRRWYSASPFENNIASVAYHEGKGGPDAFLLIKYTGNTPSDWSKEYIDEAIKENLVPEKLQDLYKENITREEFCELAYTVLSKKATQEFDKTTAPFTDTDSEAVSALFNAKIIDGKSDTIFAPNDLLTREEAAKILNNVCLAFNLEIINDDDFTFSDDDEISDWAKEFVYNMNSIKIMQGIGENTFSPKSNYTKEQAIATLLRISKK